MKKAITFLVVFILILNQSCINKNDCEDISCFTPPVSFEFELIDKLTGENLFTNETFNPNDIEIINLEDQSNIAFLFIDENNYNVISINTIGWQTETVNYSINILNESIFELFVDAERLNGACCTYTNYKEILIKSSEFVLNQDSGVYKILVD